MPTSNKVLVIQPLPGIGDMVWFTPHLRAIAATAAGGRVTLLTKTRTQANLLLTNENIVEEFIWIDAGEYRRRPMASILHLVHALKSHRFTHVWILHHSPRYALASALAGIRHRYGYGAGRLQRLLLTGDSVLPAAARRSCRIQCADQVLAMHGLSPDARCLRVDTAETAAVAARFAGVPRPWTGFGIGSSDPLRRWHARNFAALAARVDPRDERGVFLCGAAHEAPIAAEIVAAARDLGKTVIPVLDMPLTRTMALIAQCRRFVGNDSGLLNVAAALGVETIGLFGRGPVLRYRENLHAVAPLPGSSPSMEKISVDQAAEFIAAREAIPPARAGSAAAAVPL